MKRWMKRLLLLTLFGVLCVWGAAVLHCEWLTARHLEPEMTEVCEELLRQGTFESVKLLEYDPYGYAELYGRHDGMGNFFRLTSDYNDGWRVILWKTIWSDQGTADEFIWPYIR